MLSSKERSAGYTRCSANPPPRRGRQVHRGGRPIERRLAAADAAPLLLAGRDGAHPRKPDQARLAVARVARETLASREADHFEADVLPARTLAGQVEHATRRVGTRRAGDAEGHTCQRSRRLATACRPSPSRAGFALETWAG